MSAPASETGLLGSLRQLAGTLLETAQVRLALLGNEVAQEKARLLDSLLWGGFALILLGLGVLFLSAFVVTLLWDRYGPVTLAAVALLHLVLGFWIIHTTRQGARTAGPLFQASMDELARDQSALQTTAAREAAHAPNPTTPPD